MFRWGENRRIKSELVRADAAALTGDAYTVASHAAGRGAIYPEDTDWDAVIDTLRDLKSVELVDALFCAEQL